MGNRHLLIVSVILLGVLFGNSACKRQCYVTSFGNLMVSDYDSSRDTSVTIIKYATGSNFSQLIDSTEVRFYGNDAQYPFTNGESNGQYDYIIKLHPDGQTHTLKNFTFGHEKMSLTQSDQCRASMSYTLDDSVYHSGTQVTSGLEEGAIIVSN